ncbi:MAG: molybdopterin-dependent oxidoreductase, partial [Chloroflexota bacterium]
MNLNKESAYSETPQIRKTYCRICKAHCGLTVRVDQNQQILDVKADKSHPVTQGYACIKGTSLGALHTDPDRVNHPLKRVNGKLQQISWDQAIQEIGDKVRGLRKAHRKRSVGMYHGNPTFASFQNIMYSSAFLEALDSPNVFASHSVDVNNKFDVSTQMYGLSMVHPVPDFEHTQFLMCLGTNPSVSQMSVMQITNPVAKFKKIEARGGQVVMVDPRRTETAAKVGEHVFIRPGTDVYLLLAMLHVIAHENQIDTRYAEKFAHNVDQFIEVGRQWTPERVEEITGIEQDTIRRLALAYRDAKGGALYMSTGVNLGPFGSLAYWLIQGLNLLTANIDSKGGLLVPHGAFDALTLASIVGLGKFDEHRTLVGDWHRVAGCFPVAALAKEITVDHPDRIRALFVSAGNPLHSVPGIEQLKQAFEQLDLVVSIDIYQNETSAYADYILPATDMLERSDFPVSHMVLQTVPYAQFTEAVVPPQHERRPEWQIFSDLAVACGVKLFGATLCNLLPRLNRGLHRLPFIGRKVGPHTIKPEHLLALLLRWGRRTTLKELKQTPEGILLGATEPHTFLGKRVPTQNGMVQLWPEKLVASLPRLESSSE